MLAAARGHPNARIAADLGVSMDMVRKWRGRFAARGLDGLKDLPRRGRPRRISALEWAAVVALACQLPAVSGVPLARWTGPELLAEITAGLAGSLSLSSVRRILADATTGIKPFMDLAGQVLARPEYKNAPRVFIIVDNGSDHRGQAAISRLRTAHPNAIMIHTPVHASWLNPDRNLFLHHPEEGRISQRLRQPRPALRDPAGLHRPL